MKTKLTLTIEKAIIEQAKQYAKDTGQSLSELIQNYLNRLSRENVGTENNKLAEEPSKYRKMAGIIKSDLDPVKDRDKIRDIRIEKYMQ
ncbi:MAG: DUF6364 family protein [Nonlabens sp.]|uniref:DUF6364 family protein n=1 Tax=Nonlabens sp. TaxID=1888209 RepID=UPI003EF4A276